MSEFEKLKRKRSTLRSLATKSINKISDLIGTEINEVGSLEECLENLEAKAQQIYELDKEIENEINDLDELQAEVENNQEYRDKILNSKSKARKAINKFKLACKTANLDKTDVNFKENVSVESPDKIITMKRDNLKLPKLVIEHFDGNLEKFQDFFAQFESSIHNNEQLTKIDKFNYLKSFLKGSALVTIQGLLISENNYDVAIELLKERYGRKDIIVRAHINNILNLTPVRSATHLKELRNLYDICEVQIRSLKTLGVELDSYGSLLFPLLIKLIPDNIVLEFNRSCKNEDSWNVSELLNFLKAEVENRERTFLFRKNADGEENEHNLNRNKFYSSKFENKNVSNKYNGLQHFNDKKRVPSAAALSVVEDFCLFCRKSEHDSVACNKTIVERKEILKRSGRCFVCLKRHHLAKFCVSKINCEICNRRHNKLICNSLSPTNASDGVKEAAVTSVSQSSDSCGVYLQTGTALVRSKNKLHNIYYFLDNGSQRSFILESVSKQLDLPIIGEEDISIYSFGKNAPVTEKRKKVSLMLESPNNSRLKVKIEALVIPVISGSLIQSPNKEVVQLCAKSGIKLSNRFDSKMKTSEVSLLIGSDFYWKIVTGKIQRLSGSFVASETLFGWTVNGSAASELVVHHCAVNVMNVAMSKDNDSEKELCEILKKFWSLESLGITDETANNLNEDSEVIKSFEENIKFVENRYEVRLPWNEKRNELKDNYKVALNRFNSLTQKFMRNSQLYKDYSAVLEDYLQKGIAEEATEETNQMVYYMPHRAVIREDKETTKLRVVFDASSHSNDTISLNDCLSPGPNLNPDLLAILLQFRLHRISMTADLEQAFLQILLALEDRDAVRFLWTQDPIENNGEFCVKILRMTRVIFGATSSPFLLAATIKHHIRKYKSKFPREFDLLNDFLYVDDLISGTDEENEALEIRTNIINILQEASFNMRKWKTNSHTLRNVWSGSENEISKNNGDSKVLGYIWDETKDNLKIDVHCLLKDTQTKQRNITKREVLKIVSKIYDPIGFLTPFTVKARIIMQDIWKTGTKWDAVLPAELQRRWMDWCEELPQIENLNFPRHCFQNCSRSELQNVQLHTFVDASEKAYGTIIFLKYLNKEGQAHVNFIMSKTRVAPLKKISLPRLELMAALTGAKLSRYIQDKISSHTKLTPYFWTDSSATLHWIKNDPKKWKTFVKNRVIEIRKITEPHRWGYCPSKENPADLLTRGVRLNDFDKCKKWWSGPKWLIEDVDSWPTTDNLDIKEEVCYAEAKKEKKEIMQSCCFTHTAEEDLFDVKKFSSLNRVRRVTAWIFRFINNLSASTEKISSNVLSTDELKLADNYWIRRVQLKGFQNEMKSLRNGELIDNSSKIRNYNPFLDQDHLLRVGGRLQNAGLDFHQVHPIILPDNFHLTKLHIKHSHEHLGHAGTSETLTDLRERFWILKGRQQIKSVIHNCNLCRKFASKPMKQDMAPIPSDRIKEVCPFEVTGIDFAGPVYVKNKNENNKAYIALFTCAVTRSLHLELVSDLSTSKFLLAFRRFISRRGICKVIYSDNAKSFKKADADIKKLWNIMNDEETLNYYGEIGIKWKFIVERAAWWGGFWERLVRSTKMCLKKVLGKALLTYEELETTLTETEAILNSRPLTYVYNEPHEPQPLTPGHFLINKRLTSLPLGKPLSEHSIKDELTKRYKHRILTLSRIWKRWRKEYLLDLRSAHQMKFGQRNLIVKENTVVHIEDERQPRMMWRTGIISEVHTGRDGKVRSCTIRLPTGTFIKRSVQHLYPLELDIDEERTPA